MTGETSSRPSSPVDLSSPLPFTQATQYSSPSPIRNPPGQQTEGVVRRGKSPGRGEVQGVQETPPSTPVSSVLTAPVRVSQPSTSSTPRGFIAPASSHNGFIMASELPRSQGVGAKLTPEVLWTKHHDNPISGVCYRLFIKPLDRSKTQTEGSYTVMYSGHTSLYVVAVPGGGYTITSFKTHLAREGWGAYSPTARIGNFSKEGTLLPPQSFGLLLSKWFKPDYNDFMRFRKPEVVDITQVFSLGDVLWRLYSCGILDHKSQNMLNLRMQYQLLPLPTGARKSLSFTETSVVTSSAGIVASSRRPVDMSSSSEEEDEEKEIREENDRREVDRQGAQADLDILDVNLNDQAEENENHEAILNKNRNLRVKIDKLRKVAGKALRCADHFRGRVEKTENRKMRNLNKSITMCVEACVKSKFETVCKSIEETKSVILSLKTESGGVAAKTNLLLKKFEAPPALNFPPPQILFQRQQQTYQQPSNQCSNKQLQDQVYHGQVFGLQENLQGHQALQPQGHGVHQGHGALQGHAPALPIQPQGYGGHQAYQGYASPTLPTQHQGHGGHHRHQGHAPTALPTQGHEGHMNPQTHQGHRGHQAPQFHAPPALPTLPQVPTVPQPSMDLDEILASLVRD